MHMLVIRQRRIDHEEMEQLRVRDQQIDRLDPLAAGRAQREHKTRALLDHRWPSADERHRHRRSDRHHRDELRIKRIAKIDRVPRVHAKIHVAQIRAGGQKAENPIRPDGDERDKRNLPPL